ncbi:PEP-CTERM sorting domain-containing protein [Jeongeupia sp. USM3]|uniref:PEP-CTERM sorting domain-containing protein n=1 Tax=Jeongeupia sp. USM3 TaxID=1906741 RepID=UPI00089DD8BA|nr:PEP-CTERM sorting domain-containing protein [Jeongeupia sp. USM3]AOY01882.1 hypothetical protein BJP62_16370 [Jeongeupia sp. USM3]
MKSLKAIAAVTMFAAAGLSHAAFSKTYNVGVAPIAAADTFTVAGPSTLTFELLPANLTGSLANLFAVSYQLAPVGQLVGLQSLVFNQGTRSFSGSFNLPAAGTYTSFFAVTKDANWVGKLNLNVVPVPEPETYALMGAGLLGVLLSRRRKQRTAIAA